MPPSDAAGAEAERRGGSRFLGVATRQAAAGTLAHGCGMLGSLILARCLGPYRFGLIQGFKVLLAQGDIASLGARQGAVFMIPARRASDGIEGAHRLAGTGFWLYLAPQILFSVALLVWSLALPPAMAGLRGGYLAASLAVLALGVAGMVEALSLALEEHSARARYVAASAAVQLATIVLTVGTLGENSFWLATFLGAAAAVPLWQALGGARLLAFHREEVGGMYRVGFPLFLAAQIQSILSQVERALVGILLGAESLGLLSLGNMATQGLTVVVQGITGPWGPKSMRLLAGGELGAFRTRARDLARGLGWLVAFMLLWSSALMVVLVELLLPRFAPGIPAALLAASSVYAVGQTTAMGFVYVWSGWQPRLLPYSAVCLVFSASLSLLAIDRGLGIPGVAVALSVSRNLMSLATVYLGWRMVGSTVGEAVVASVDSHLPLVFLVGASAAGVLGALALGMTSASSLVLAAAAIGSLCLAPALPAVWKTLELDRRLRAPARVDPAP